MSKWILCVILICYSNSWAGSAEVNISDIDEEDYADVVELSIDDRFEGANRIVLSFNDALDKILLRPLALTYDTFVPSYGRDRVHSVLSNLHEPLYAFNHALQGDPDKAFRSIGRFLTNTIFGLFGLFDIASEAGVVQGKTDFGLTLKKAGMKPGPYLVLPVFGPSNLRDATGAIVDLGIDPIRYAKFKNTSSPRLAKRRAANTRYGVEMVDTRQRMNKLYEQLDTTSLDKYLTLRNIYVQKR